MDANHRGPEYVVRRQCTPLATSSSLDRVLLLREGNNPSPALLSLRAAVTLHMPRHRLAVTKK